MAIPLWMEGVADAVGFLIGAAAGFGIGQLLGCDVLSPGYSITTIIGIALVGLGGGAGLQIARMWRLKRSEQRNT